MLTGLLLAWSYGELEQALTLQPAARLIGIGMWLALIMAFNVWFIIWPARRRCSAWSRPTMPRRRSAATAGLIASRTNILLSIPMLLAMTNAH